VNRAGVWLAALVVASACASAPRGAMVEGAANAQPLEGTVAVRTTLTGKPCDDAERCAQIEAVRAVLFLGVPNSPASKPLVSDESAAMKANRAYFDDLLGKNGYAKFIVRSAGGALAARDPGRSAAYTVVVNLQTLRTSLENAGVIRRFGF
jgi:hypothetical protein